MFRAGIGGLIDLKTIAFLLAVALFAGCAHGPSTGPARLKVGGIAPVFLLDDVRTGGRIDAGQVFYDHVATVVIIWSMTCPSCREALLECEHVYEQYSGKAVAFLGVNFDKENLNGIRAFLNSEGITFPNLWDPRTRATRAYRALDYTFSAFVVDREGQLKLVQYDHPPNLESLLTQSIDRTTAEEVEESTGEKR